MTESLIYKDLNFLKAAADFSGSEKLEKARRNYLVFLTILLFVEFADIQIQSATLGFVSAKIGYPEIVTIGFWLIFLYTFLVYLFSGRKELELFSFKNGQEATFFAQLNRLELIKKIGSASLGRLTLPAGSGFVEHSDNKKTSIKYEVNGIPEEVLKEIENYDFESRIFTYTHSDEDLAFLKKSIRVIRPSLKYNYFVYIFPLHCGAALVGFTLSKLILQTFGIIA